MVAWRGQDVRGRYCRRWGLEGPGALLQTPLSAPSCRVPWDRASVRHRGACWGGPCLWLSLRPHCQVWAPLVGCGLLASLKSPCSGPRLTPCRQVFAPEHAWGGGGPSLPAGLGRAWGSGRLGPAQRRPPLGLAVEAARRGGTQGAHSSSTTCMQMLAGTQVGPPGSPAR